jgi:hypothetical protein
MKDVFIELVERRTQVLMDAGMDEEAAYKMAGETIYNGGLRDHLADKADMARLLQKERGTAK